MTEQESEKFISQLFAALPRQVLFLSSKEQVWQRVANEIRKTTRAPEAEKISVWRFLLLPRTLMRVGATVIVIVLTLTMVGSVARAQPGETLYSVKIAAEQVELVLATGDEAKVNVGIKHAKRRLEEVKTLVAGNGDTEIVEQTLEALTATTDELVGVAAVSESNPELAGQAAELAVEQEQVLSGVETAAADEVKGAVQNAIAAAKESISKLAGNEVQGVAASAEENASTPTTTVNTLAPAPPVVVKKPKKDAPLNAGIQIDEVITIGDDNEPRPAGN